MNRTVIAFGIRALSFGLLVSFPWSVWAKWRDQTLPVELQVGYAVTLVDLSGDGALDIALVDSKRFLWLENPTWKVHIMHSEPDAAHDNVCFAPHDVDGDGDLDFAVGRDWQFGNSDSGGHVGWLRQNGNPRQPWTYIPIMEEPTTHRMRWIDFDHDGSHELLVAPLKGRGSRAPGFENSTIRLLALTPPGKGASAWKTAVIDDSLHVAHNIDVVDIDRDGSQDLLVASFEGVTRLQHNATGPAKRQRLGSGQVGTAPAIGASEIRLGRLGDQASYLATIEPWHGDKVVVYTEPSPGANSNETLWTRHVLDEELKWGHAVACANLDQDPDEELIIGVRDHASENHRCGVRIYDPVDALAGKWQRQLVSPGQVAVEDLTVGDLDGDGDPDLVAVGRATHNAVIYWNE